MLYNSNIISQFCLTTRKLYSFILIFCFVCKSRQEIIDLDSSLLSLPKLTYMTQQLCNLLVASTKQDNINACI